MINSYSIFMQKYILYLARRVIGQSLILVNYAADHFSGTFELCMTKSRLDYGSTIAGTTNKFRTETNSVKLNFFEFPLRIPNNINIFFRKCGRAVCDGCSSKKSALPYKGHEIPVRVCEECYIGITEEE